MELNFFKKRELTAIETEDWIDFRFLIPAFLNEENTIEYYFALKENIKQIFQSFQILQGKDFCINQNPLLERYTTFQTSRKDSEPIGYRSTLRGFNIQYISSNNTKTRLEPTETPQDEEYPILMMRAIPKGQEENIKISPFIFGGYSPTDFAFDQFHLYDLMKDFMSAIPVEKEKSNIIMPIIEGEAYVHYTDTLIDILYPMYKRLELSGANPKLEKDIFNPPLKEFIKNIKKQNKDYPDENNTKWINLVEKVM